MITAFDESAREERMYAQARLNAQNINFIEDKYEEEPQVINCNFEIIYGNRRVGPHNPGKLIWKTSTNIYLLIYMATFSIITAVKKTLKMYS